MSNPDFEDAAASWMSQREEAGLKRAFDLVRSLASSLEKPWSLLAGEQRGQPCVADEQRRRRGDARAPAVSKRREWRSEVGHARCVSHTQCEREHRRTLP